jgi:hypothetical protein
MAQSILRFNHDKIPLYMSVPSAEIELFKKTFQNLPCHFVTDEEILNSSCKIYGPLPRLFPNHLLQQLIKLEFWRLKKGDYYLWLDSDSYFLRPFHTRNFFHDESTPLLVMHHAQDLRKFAIKHDPKIVEKLDSRIKSIQQLFGRKGESFYFGDPPLIWNSSILEAMSSGFLKSRGMTIYELLYRYPCEMQLYGEFALASNLQPIVPTQLFFKVFHYAEQFFESQRKGESEHSLARRYFGVTMQSNWTNEKEKKKNDIARFKKFLREQQRKIGLIKFQRF